MDKARFPLDRSLVEDWIERHRDTTLTHAGLQRWEEWWVLARFAETDAAQKVLPAKFTACHGDEPDFRIEGGDRHSFGLEITEATTPEDRREIANQPPDGKGRLFGSAGGRGADGVVGNKWEQWVVDDLVSAVTAKAKKTYAPGCGLVCYINSNASFADMHVVSEMLPLRHNKLVSAELRKFRFVALLAADGKSAIVVHSQSEE